MSWNPLQKLFSHDTRSKLITELPTTQETRDVEELIKRYNKYTDVSRLLGKEAKLFTECVSELLRCETTITKDLSQSQVCHYHDEFRVLMEEYHSVCAQSQEPCGDLILVLQKTLTEPLKRYKRMFTSIDACLRRRDLLFQEYHKNFSKVEKLKTKEKTGNNVAKLSASQRTVSNAQKEIAILNQQLLQAFPLVFKARLEYIQPCIEALLRAKISYFDEFSHLVKGLVQSPLATTMVSDDKYNDLIQQRMAEIKKLNIVVPE